MNVQLQGERDKTEETLYLVVDSSSSFLEVPQLFLRGCPGPWLLLKGSLCGGRGCLLAGLWQLLPGEAALVGPRLQGTGLSSCGS